MRSGYHTWFGRFAVTTRLGETRSAPGVGRAVYSKVLPVKAPARTPEQSILYPSGPSTHSCGSSWKTPGVAI